MSLKDAEFEPNSWRMQSMPAMEDTLFNAWVELIFTRTGIRLPSNRKTFLLSSLSIRMRELKIHDYHAYYDLVTTGSHGLVEWETLVDRLTVHETRFWRDEQCLNLIRDEYLKNISSQPEPLKIWSVGCATGEEPYSLAILLDSYLSTNALRTKYEVHATDISLAALSTGRAGKYPQNRLTNVPQLLLKTYFKKIGDTHYAISDHIKERVCFTKLNLLAANTFPFSGLDIIVCQNVLIYFEQSMRQKLLNSIVTHLKPGGLLILGAGEVSNWKNKEIETIHYDGALAYKRVCQ